MTVGNLRKELSIRPSIQNAGSPAPKTSRKRKSPEGMATPTEAIYKKPKTVPVASDPEVSDTSKVPQTVHINKSPKSFLIKVVISWDYMGNRKDLEVLALVDTGAECSVFDISFVEENLLPWKQRATPLRIVGADGSRCQRAGRIQAVGLTLEATDARTGKRRQTPFVAETMDMKEKYPLILGWDWLHAHVDKIHTRTPGIEFPPEVELVEVHDNSEWEEVIRANTWIGHISISHIVDEYMAELSVIEYDSLETQEGSHHLDR